MLRITLYKSEGGSNIGFDIAGHACYDVPGKDIVCAAISTLSQSIIEYAALKMDPKEIAIQDVNGITFVHNVKEHRQHTRIEALLDSFEITANIISQQYPNNVQVVVNSGCKFDISNCSVKLTM